MRTFASFILRVSRELPKSRSCFKTRPHFPPSLITPQKHMIGRNYSIVIGKPTGASGASFEVDVTSRDMIKPSSPTPSHLRTLQFSFLDQLTYSIFVPFITFYKNDPNFLANNPVKRTTWLKKSLCETLVDFYPLAGRIGDRESVINCSDEGVEFCEARVDQSLSKVIEDPNLDELQALLPFQVIPRHKNIVLSVQVNHLCCGGMAIGVCISHKIADFSSIVYFLKSWANKAFNNNDIARPRFEAASVLPPLEDLNGMITADDVQHDPSSVIVKAKRLIFDENKLDELKATAKSIGNLKNPPKVELVTAFIWNKLIEAAATEADFTKMTTCLHTVNLRTRMEPALPETYFGNFAWLARTPPMPITTTTAAGGSQNEMMMIQHLKKSFNKIDHNYVKQLLCNERDLEKLKKEFEYLVHDRDKCINFTSARRFSLSNLNFGMGAPIWSCITTSPIKDMVVLFATDSGKGIEAWIHMRDSDIAILDHLLR